MSRDEGEDEGREEEEGGKRGMRRVREEWRKKVIIKHGSRPACDVCESRSVGKTFPRRWSGLLTSILLTEAKTQTLTEAAETFLLMPSLSVSGYMVAVLPLMDVSVKPASLCSSLDRPLTSVPLLAAGLHREVEVNWFRSNLLAAPGSCLTSSKIIFWIGRLQKETKLCVHSPDPTVTPRPSSRPLLTFVSLESFISSETHQQQQQQLPDTCSLDSRPPRPQLVSGPPQPHWERLAESSVGHGGCFRRPRAEREKGMTLTMQKELVQTSTDVVMWSDDAPSALIGSSVASSRGSLENKGKLGPSDEGLEMCGDASCRVSRAFAFTAHIFSFHPTLQEEHKGSDPAHLTKETSSQPKLYQPPSIDAMSCRKTSTSN
ncbi:unnamed protein product [Pleuronectes platessa]|uniref:Uncharacterized protein n=1 Tax=Pleuronectes platessa TaxID=8262 RepID=A0A9N7YNG4_PLEPL|nr:unnamed protein product [Pleuronectes platessa]